MYTTVTTGERRTFTITVGLRVGYDEGNLVLNPCTADDVVARWMEDRVQKELLPISGFFTSISLHYVRNEGGEMVAGREPGLRFWGDVSIRRLSQLSSEAVIEILNDLADTLGEALRQEHVIVSYRDETWVRERQNL